MLIKKISNRARHFSRNLKNKLKDQWYTFLLMRGKFDNNDRIGKLHFDEEWEERIKKVITSEYNCYIPRVTEAGKISSGFQTMHNGLKISTGDYYGLPIAKMLYQNKGVHEPEEEKIFKDILSKMPDEPVMVEMGSYWAFYSMWFMKETKQGKVFMIEPEIKNLVVGKKNFAMNNLKGVFDHYFIGKASRKTEDTEMICLDDYVELRSINHINIAHTDIQGYEMDMLIGASKTLKAQLVDYFFISTHTNELHYNCIEYLKANDYSVIFEVDLDHVASFDGFILAVSNRVQQKTSFLNILS